MTTKQLHSRAEVVGYSEPVLDAVRDLVRQVDANPEMATFCGQMIASLSESLFPECNKGARLMAAIGRVLILAAEVAPTKES